jgi:hypothetical protein
MALLVSELTTDEMELGDIASPTRRTGEQNARWILAACSLGAAAIHFAYAPSHLSQYWLYGVFFVVLAWAQVLWAFGIVTRTWKWLPLLGVTGNAAVIAVWAMTRTIGAGIGPDATLSEAATFPDITATELEAVVLVGSLMLLVRPAFLLGRRYTGWRSPALLGSAFVLIAGTAGYGMAPRFAAGHTHAALTGTTPCEKAGPPASQGQVLDGSGHFHRGPTAQQPIDQATRLELEAQQQVARAVAAKYPTVADAEHAGYQKSTAYVPCIGAHYTNVALAGAFAPGAPSELLYDGTTPGARIVGLSYLVYHPFGPPAGFAGPNDVWHQHTFNGGLCISDSGLVLGAEATTPAQCAALGGRKIPLTDIWMLHDWVVPGFECSWGVFAAECPELGGRIGGTAWDPPNPNSGPIPLS